jgi:hypothetical protein
MGRRYESEVRIVDQGRKAHSYTMRLLQHVPGTLLNITTTFGESI